MISQIDRDDDIDEAHSPSPYLSQLVVFEVPDIVVDCIVPDSPKVLREGYSKEGAVHDELYCEGEEDGDEDCEHDSFEDFFDHGHEYAKSKVYFIFEGGQDMVKPKNDEL